jgi:hypothetical protein
MNRKKRIRCHIARHPSMIQHNRLFFNGWGRIVPDERRRKANVRGGVACVPSDVKYNDLCGRFATRTDVGYDELRA